MTDRFSGKAFTDPQSESIKSDIKARKFQKKDAKEEKAPTNLSDLYNKGIEHLKTFNFVVELDEGGDHAGQPGRAAGAGPRCTRPRRSRRRAP